MYVNMSVICELMFWSYFDTLDEFEEIWMNDHRIKSGCSFACWGQLKAEKCSVIFEHLLTAELSEVRERIELADVRVEIPCDNKGEISRDGVH